MTMFNSELVSTQIARLENKQDMLYAGNPETSTSLLDLLAHSVHPTIRSRVAENPNIPVSLLAAFLWDREPEVRASVAANPNATMAMLRWLTNDECVDVRFALAEDPALPMALLQRLSSDSNVFVAERAQTTIAKMKREQTKTLAYVQIAA
jgi:hypothetical protein